MKQPQKCTVIKSALLLAVLCTATVVQAAGVGTVTLLSGPLLAKKANGTMRVLGAKSTVEAGDTLSTQGKAYAQVRFSDGSTLILQPDTTLTIDKFSYDAAKPAADNVAFTLVQGGVRSNAGSLGKRSKDSVQMVTPSASISMQAANVVVQYIKPTAEAVAAARHAYLLASTAALDLSMHATRSDMPAPAAIQPLLLAQVNIPLPTGLKPNAVGSTPPLPPGLYVQVIDGLINVTNKGGTQNFSAGQFGFTPTPIQAPVVVPRNPGLQFTPPPAFSVPMSNTPGASSAPPKSNAVDCVVR
ncbi:iron dicitrate transport regulator FecR [Herminiimonas sp. KBW02]|uniref:FecR family protein n=1 Tax=Herminiimonas sp. KBW02 TaxID=2153363 RepID=UPI000F5B0D61|nr:FecR domain-containing protein [Herminiimonas sp. KBW02]RQO37237.1 iron dicitrate transport regulator FecR [Herminiimonas sp. KBW02]